MDRDEFIITVYCLVWEPYQVINNIYALRHGGFAPPLSDEEVLTLELCGAYCKLAPDKDRFGDCRPPYAPFFPRLSARTRFVRQAATSGRSKPPFSSG